MFVRDEFIDFNANPRWYKYQRNYIAAPLGKTFYVTFESKPFYYLRGVIVMGGGVLLKPIESDSGDIVLPAGVKIDVHPGDKAVYIGTIRYERDDFFSITKVSIRDDYEHENAAFIKKFGKGHRHAYYDKLRSPTIFGFITLLSAEFRKKSVDSQSARPDPSPLWRSFRRL